MLNHEFVIVVHHKRLGAAPEQVRAHIEVGVPKHPYHLVLRHVVILIKHVVQVLHEVVVID